MSIAGISFNEADGQIFLMSHPVPGRAPISAADLLALLEQAGFGQCWRQDDAFADAARKCNNQEQSFGVMVAERRDACIQVQLTADDMSAEVSIEPPHGGKAATVQDVTWALATAGVTFGIDETAVKLVCQLGQCQNIALAKGVALQHGTGTVFEELIPQTAQRTPKVNEQGLIDYRERGDIQVVAAGAPLMRRIPATPGVDGQTVKGHKLVAKPGHDERFASPLAGAQVSAKDSNLLEAAVSGQPVRVQCGITVEPVLRVKEVNMATGNIHFDGTVHVAGEVVQGMAIKASGDIVVDGMVDGATLEAGGDIVVAGGVIAHAKLHAAGAVTARFAQGASIYAGTVISLADMAMECQLQSLNQIIIGTESPQRGRLVGGTASAALLLSVPVLGSNKSGITKVIMGANPELEARYAALQLRIEQEKANEANLEKLVKQLTAAKDPKGMLERVKTSRQHAIQVWGKSLAESAEMEKELELAQSAKVVLGVGVAGAVDLSFGKLVAKLRHDFDAGTFALEAGVQLVFTDAQGQVLPVL